MKYLYILTLFFIANALFAQEQVLSKQLAIDHYYTRMYKTNAGNVLLSDKTDNQIICLNKDLKELYRIDLNFKLSGYYYSPIHDKILVYSRYNKAIKGSEIHSYSPISGKNISKFTLPQTSKMSLRDEGFNVLSGNDEGVIRSENEKYVMLIEKMGKYKMYQDYSKGMNLYVFDENFNFKTTQHFLPYPNEETLEIIIDDKGIIYRVMHVKKGAAFHLKFYRYTPGKNEPESLTYDHLPIKKYDYSEYGKFKFIDGEPHYGVTYRNFNKGKTNAISILKLDFPSNKVIQKLWTSIDTDFFLEEAKKSGLIDKDLFVYETRIGDIFVYDYALNIDGSFDIFAQQHYSNTTYNSTNSTVSASSSYNPYRETLYQIKGKNSTIESIDMSLGFAVPDDIAPVIYKEDNFESILLKGKIVLLALSRKNGSDLTSKVEILRTKKSYVVEEALWINKNHMLVRENRKNQAPELNLYKVIFND